MYYSCIRKRNFSCIQYFSLNDIFILLRSYQSVVLYFIMFLYYTAFKTCNINLYFGMCFNAPWHYASYNVETVIYFSYLYFISMWSHLIVFTNNVSTSFISNDYCINMFTVMLQSVTTTLLHIEYVRHSIFIFRTQQNWLCQMESRC